MEEYILICDGSPAGIFTAVYTAYEKKYPLSLTYIRTEEEETLRLFASYLSVPTEEEKAVKVGRSLRRRLGERVTRALWHVMASPHPDRGTAVLRTAARGLSGECKGYLLDNLQDPYIALAASLDKTIRNEIHHYYGFLRFSELRGGILYAEIEPKGQLLEFLGEHFSDRFPEENFVIRDVGREEYLVHPAGKGWFLAGNIKGDFQVTSGRESGEGSEEGDGLIYSHREEEIRKLFRGFVHAISIEARENKNLQRQLLPLRFRPYMVDFR
ncbi:MAG: TIGR03915 family putative DNA repair protein [Lachnospiraceae bacterium]|nr:TIGR03915 family putative DNA repair protein [Lachnospiraceae bacterium]